MSSVTLIQPAGLSERELPGSQSMPAPFAQLQSESFRGKMQLPTNVRTLCSRFQTILRQRRRKEKRVSVSISAPFDFKRESVGLPGVSDDEISMLREKAAASRIGIADPLTPRSPRSPRSAYSTSGLFSHPVRPPALSVSYLTTARPLTRDSMHSM